MNGNSTSKLTLNYGARFGCLSPRRLTTENQFSPRANLVYQPFEGTTLHAGYSRYFTPPPVEKRQRRHAGKIHVGYLQ